MLGMTVALSKVIKL